MFENAEIIYQYTRANAIQDGVLVEVSAQAKEAGFVIPVAITSALAAEIKPGEKAKSNGQSFSGRLWDVLTILRRVAQRHPDRNSVPFSFLLDRDGIGELEIVNLRAVVGPGDQAEPVITIGYPDPLDPNDVT